MRGDHASCDVHLGHVLGAAVLPGEQAYTVSY